MIGWGHHAIGGSMGPSVKSQGNMFVASGPDNTKVPEFLLTVWKREVCPLTFPEIPINPIVSCCLQVFHFFETCDTLYFFLLLPGDAKDAGWGEGLGLGLHWRLLPEWCLLQANG